MARKMFFIKLNVSKIKGLTLSFLIIFSINIYSSDTYDVSPLVAPVKYEKENIFARANDEFSKKHYIKAYKFFMLSQVPKNIKLFNAALSLERAGRYSEAFKLYKKLGTIDSFYRMSVCSASLNKWISVIKYLELWHQHRQGLAYDFEYSARLGEAYLNLDSLNYAEKFLFKAKTSYINNIRAILIDAEKKHLRKRQIDTLGIITLRNYSRLNISLAKQIKLNMTDTKILKENVKEKFAYYLLTENTYFEMISRGDILLATRGLYDLAVIYLNIYNELIKIDKKLLITISSLLKKSEIVLKKNIEISDKYSLKNTWTTESRLLIKKVKTLINTGGEW